MRTKKEPVQEKRCQMQRKDGRQCRAARLKGSEYCLFHHPWTQEHRKKFEELRELPLRESSEIHGLLVEAVRAVEAGRMNAQQAYALGWLVRLVQENLTGLEEETEACRKEGQVQEGEPEFGEATKSRAAETREEKADGEAEEAGRGQSVEE
jgi:hypothetical protein